MLGSRKPGSSVIPAEHREDVEQTLLQKIAEAGGHINTGFIGNKYAWPALSAMGRVEQALELALQTTCPSYGYQEHPYLSVGTPMCCVILSIPYQAY